MNLVAIIANLQQYHLVTSKYPAAGIATADSAVFLAAKHHGKNVWDLWSFLNQEENTGNRQWAWDVCERFADIRSPSFQLGKINIVAQARLDFFHTWLAIRNTSMAVGRFLQSVNPAEVVIFSEASDVNYEALPICHPDVFNVAAHLAAQRYGAKVIETSIPPDSQGKGMKKTGKKLMKSRPLDLAELQKIKYLCVAVDLGISEQQSLYDYLDKDRTSEWVVLGDQPTGNSIPFIAVKPLVWLSVNYHGPVRVNPDELAQGAGNMQTGDDEIFFPIADHKFAFVWNCFARHCENAAMSYQAASFINEAFAPVAVVNGFDIYAGGRCFVTGIREHGVRVYSIDHGTLIIDDLNHQYNHGLSHIVVRGEIDRKYRLPTREPGAEVIVAGCMRNDHAMKKPEADSRAKKIVILTGKTNSGGNFSGFTDSQSLYDTWQYLFQWFKEKPDFSFVIKCHPRYDTPAFYRELASQFSNVTVLAEMSPDLYDGALVSVMMNNPTTASLYAIEQGVPVVYLRNAIMAWADSPFDHAEEIPGFNELPAFTSFVESLAADSVARNALISRQRSFYASSIAATGGEAARRLVETVVHADTSRKEPARKQIEAVSVVIITCARAYLSGEIGLMEYHRRLRVLKPDRDILAAVQIRHGSLFKYILWADDVPAGKCKRLMALMTGWMNARSIARHANFRLLPHVVELFKSTNA